MLFMGSVLLINCCFSYYKVFCDFSNLNSTLKSPPLSKYNHAISTVFHLTILWMVLWVNVKVWWIWGKPYVHIERGNIEGKDLVCGNRGVSGTVNIKSLKQEFSIPAIEPLFLGLFTLWNNEIFCNGLINKF